MPSYFRMSDAILDCPCALELQRRTPGDRFDALRMMLFIRILTFSLSSSKFFVDAQSLAAYAGTPITQTQRVWDTCIKFGVLRRSGYGFSAKDWMIENGFLGRYDKEKQGTEKRQMKQVKQRQKQVDDAQIDVRWEQPPEPPAGTPEHDEWERVMVRARLSGLVVD